MTVKVNKIQCNICKECVESVYRHNFVACKCFRDSGGTTGCWTDGGKEYIRRGGDPDSFVDLSIFEDDFLGS